MQTFRHTHTDKVTHRAIYNVGALKINLFNLSPTLSRFLRNCCCKLFTSSMTSSIVGFWAQGQLAILRSSYSNKSLLWSLLWIRLCSFLSVGCKRGMSHPRASTELTPSEVPHTASATMDSSNLEFYTFSHHHLPVPVCRKAMKKEVTGNAELQWWSVCGLVSSKLLRSLLLNGIKKTDLIWSK